MEVRQNAKAFCSPSFLVSFPRPMDQGDSTSKKGFAMDDGRLKELGGGGYFKELLERIRDIRSSEIIRCILS